MRTRLSKPISLFLAVTVLTIVSSAVSAQGEMAQNNNVSPMEIVETTSNVEQPQLQPTETTEATLQPTEQSATNQGFAGEIKTSAVDLLPEGVNSQPTETIPNKNEVAQLDVDPGRSTRGGSSYIGIAGNIGFTGDDALGEGAVAIISKIGVTRNFSFRPSAVLGDNTVFLLPVTYDLSVQTADPFERIPFAPYIGVGAGVVTNGDVGFLVTGGVDVPLSRQFTATAGVNALFKGQTDVGILLGVGYNFSGF